MPIVWTDDARRYRIPTRADDLAPDTSRPAILWQRCVAAFTPSKTWFADGHTVAPPETGALQQSATEILGRSEPPAEIDVDVAAMMMAITAVVHDWLRVAHGPAFMLRAAIRANDFQRAWQRNLTYFVPAPADGTAIVFAPSLRTAILCADGVTREDCRRIAAGAWPTARPAVRVLLAAWLGDPGWVREATAAAAAKPALARDVADALLASAGDVETAGRVLELGGISAGVVTVVDRFGEAAAPVLARALENAQQSHARKHVARALGLIHTREAAAVLAAHLGLATVRPFAADLFAANHALARELLPPIATGKNKAASVARDLLCRIDRADARAAGSDAEAKPASLPRVLADPPWRTRRRPQRRRVVLPDLALLPYEERVTSDLGRVVTMPGYLAQPGSHGRAMTEEELARYVAECRDVGRTSRIGFPYDWRNRIHVPVEKQLALWNDASLSFWRNSVTMIAMLHTHGAAALPGVVAGMGAGLGQIWCNPAEKTLLLGLDTPRVAAAYARHMTARRAGDTLRRWLGEDPTRAAVGLIPAALAEPDAQRESAERALRMLEAHGHGDALRAVADRYGAQARAGLDEVLAWDPVWDCPKKAPKLPAFYRPAELTRPRLRTGEPLPHEALEHLAEMLKLTEVDPPYAGIAHVADACDARSLAEHAWDLAVAWETAGAPKTEAWMLRALVHYADDEVTRRTTPALRSPKIVEVLGRIGSDAAAMELASIVARGKSRRYSSLAHAAEAAIAAIAEGRGIERDVLEDAITPTLDVDAAGGLDLDYGSRTLRVGFDERLEPFVLDERGERMKNLPPGRKTDDAAKVKLARAAWKELREDVRVVADRRIDALERAMCTGRGWAPDAFRTAFVDHPLVLHLARRLVWAADGRTFRVAEDRSLADARDEPIALADDATITLPHPAAWPDGTLERWREVLRDYQLLQPFAQLDRPGIAAAHLEATEIAHERDQPLADVHLTLSTRGWTHAGRGNFGARYRKPMGNATAEIELAHAEPKKVLLRVLDATGTARMLGSLGIVAATELWHEVFTR